MNENWGGNYNNYNQMPNMYAPPTNKIIKVNGEQGAHNFRMGPNSEALLLDETAPLIQYAQTDGTGYMTLTPFDIQRHQDAQTVTLQNLSDRLTQVEEYIKNAQQSNSGNARQQAKHGNNQPKGAPATTNPISE